MHICFYSPYLPQHFGGGEKHLLDVAVTAARSHTVSIAISGSHSAIELEAYKKKYELFYDLALEEVHFITTPLGTSEFFATKLNWTKNFDGLYYVTDGSFFFSLAKHNFLHVQIPFTHALSMTDKAKLLCWQHINTNSGFTKKVIEKKWGVKVQEVLHPMVDLSKLKVAKKEKIILNVGRFFKQLHSKRQDVLVSAFKQLIEKHTKLMQGWQLYLVGSVEDQAYLKEIKAAAAGIPIVVETKLDRQELLKLYSKSSIYWHATGFEVDEWQEPSKVEHFGITTIEAMAAQALPLVVAKGGQAEVLGALTERLSWQTITECVEKTAALINDSKQAEALRPVVMKQAAQFSKEIFEKKVEKLFSV